MLDPVDGAKDLTHLVDLGFTSVVLNVDTRVALPRCLVDAVARAALAGSAEEVVTDAAQVGEADAAWVVAHGC